MVVLEKVKVNKRVYDSFKATETDSWYFTNKEKYLTYMLKYKTDKLFGIRSDELNHIEIEVFLKCLTFGYELEETKEEILLKKYKEKLNIYEASNVNDCHSFCEGMKYALNMLNKKVEDINF